MTRAPAPQRLAIAAGALIFCVVATLNSGGYRYGVGDQAFYIPAVVQHLDPSLFPRDRVLLHVQDRFMAFDDITAMVVRAGVPLPALSFGLYLLALLLLYGAAIAVGRTLYTSWWTVVLLVALLTLRHRITETGANSLEAYFHPRILAFALGFWGLACYLRGRSLAALVLTAAAFLVHSTTAVWFSIWIGTALVVSERWLRRPMLVLGALAVVFGVWAVAAGPLKGHLVRMDPRWASALAGKDYIFPFDWTPAFWAVNLGYAAAIGGVYWLRRAKGVAGPRESGLVAGAACLLLVFLASWPLMSNWIALALQLQTSRIFWLLDMLAAIFLAWALAEGASGRARRAVVVLVVAAAVLRGGYVTAVEHHTADFVSIDLPNDSWTDAMRWIARTPAGTHVLADPGHAWKYGTSVRVAGERDVYLEEVKDSALALYSREVAMDVLRRMEDAHDFASLTPARALALARQYDLDYLIVDHDMELPLTHRSGQFRIYALAPAR